MNNDDDFNYYSNQVLDVRVHHGEPSALRVVPVLNKMMLIDIIIIINIIIVLTKIMLIDIIINVISYVLYL